MISFLLATWNAVDRVVLSFADIRIDTYVVRAPPVSESYIASLVATITVNLQLISFLPAS